LEVREKRRNEGMERRKDPKGGKTIGAEREPLTQSESKGKQRAIFNSESGMCRKSQDRGQVSGEERDGKQSFSIES
jgi:hypothetical protein